nr:hypothetical protein [Micromonospora sp. DSM 115978]
MGDGSVPPSSRRDRTEIDGVVHSGAEPAVLIAGRAMPAPRPVPPNGDSSPATAGPTDLRRPPTAPGRAAAPDPTPADAEAPGSAPPTSRRAVGPRRSPPGSLTGTDALTGAAAATGTATATRVATATGIAVASGDAAAADASAVAGSTAAVAGRPVSGQVPGRRSAITGTRSGPTSPVTQVADDPDAVPAAPDPRRPPDAAPDPGRPGDAVPGRLRETAPSAPIAGAVLPVAPATATRTGSSSAPAATTVTVTIGRIEVRPPPVPPARPTPAPGPRPLSLADYLDRRRGAGS